MLFDMLVGLLHRLTTPSGREGGQDCDGALSQAPIRSLPTRPDHLWMRLPDRADRSTQGHQVVRNRGQTLSGSTTIMLTVVPREQIAADAARVFERAEPVRKLGAVLQGPELRFRERIVVAHARPRMTGVDAQVREEQRDELAPLWARRGRHGS